MQERLLEEYTGGKNKQIKNEGGVPEIKKLASTCTPRHNSRVNEKSYTFAQRTIHCFGGPI